MDRKKTTSITKPAGVGLQLLGLVVLALSPVGMYMGWVVGPVWIAAGVWLFILGRRPATRPPKCP